jgi:hypothetical protein
MAFTYGTLTGPKSTQGSIRSWVNYELIDVEGALLDAQAYIYGSLRVREMRSMAPVTIAAGAVSAPLPDGFLEAISFRLPDGSRLTPRDEADILDRQFFDSEGVLEEGEPDCYGIWDEAFQFNLKTPAAIVARLLHNRRLPYLGRTNPTNFLTTRYPNLLRVACLMHAADGIQDDEQYARWKQRTDELIAKANVEADLGMRGRDFDSEVR